ncbi:MAG: hypothetical protein JJ974_08725 [Phycisphaerales bacterium]|nr:hypothetical protein [Phycisphaerales bacterium]
MLLNRISNRLRLLQVLAIGAVLVCADQSHAQTWGGSYQGTLQGGGTFTVNWTVTIGRRVCYYGWSLEGFEPVIEGPDVELVEVGEPARDVERVAEYRVLDYARDLLSGRFSRSFDEINERVVASGGEPMERMSSARMKEEVVAAYGAHLSEHPEDWLVVREMGVALLQSGRVEDAMNMIHEAYLKNPELGILPLNRSILGELKEPLRKLVVRAVQHTNREPSAKGWLTVAMLMQAQGRYELSGEMLDRAEELGLDETIVEGFRASLP